MRYRRRRSSSSAPEYIPAFDHRLPKGSYTYPERASGLPPAIRRLIIITVVVVGLLLLLLLILFVVAVVALIFAGPELFDQFVRMLGSPSVKSLLRTLNQLRTLFTGGGG